MPRVGLFKKIWAETLPFVARSPERKVAWLVGVLNRKALTAEEIAPYIHIMLNEYHHAEELDQKAGNGNDCERLAGLFAAIPREIITEIINCTSIYDIPLLLTVIRTITEDEAVLILKKIPPVYEKKPTRVFDLVFQAIHNCGEYLLPQAKIKMRVSGDMPEHFNSIYERFQEILRDKEILSSIFPQSQMPTAPGAKK
ncbi:MAG: hypothetical protein GXP59_00430 [Deltaproteobacteria bacterium]|nr:hypothetical protein [Deltaproteobacteria bacterium]